MMTRCKRFTLVELLVVIAIIAVLAGLLFPALAGARDAARRTKAKAEMKMLQTAITMWDSDLGSLPVPDDAKIAGAAPTVDTALGDLAYDQLIWMLQSYKAPGEANWLTTDRGRYENPRRKRYMDVDTAKVLALDTDPSDADKKRPFLFDPWTPGGSYSATGAWPTNPSYTLNPGNCRRYHVVMDYNYDQQITGFAYETVQGSVAIWCFGKNHSDNNGDSNRYDDVNNWR